MHVIILTDGAPRDPSFYPAAGFSTWSSYARLRDQETRSSLRVAGIDLRNVIFLRIPDMEAVYHLPHIVDFLHGQILRGSYDFVVTHAYEGGHVDHDATSFAVRAACRLVERRSVPPTILEIPLYHWNKGKFVKQVFCGDIDDQPDMFLDTRLSELKQRMLSEHATQRTVLRQYDSQIERVRFGKTVDFRRKPQGSDADYSRIIPDLNSKNWTIIVCRAAAELGIPPIL